MDLDGKNLKQTEFFTPLISFLNQRKNELKLFFGENSKNQYFWHLLPHHFEYAEHHTITIGCALSFEYYPFDSHQCKISIFNVLISVVGHEKELNFRWANRHMRITTLYYCAELSIKIFLFTGSPLQSPVKALVPSTKVSKRLWIPVKFARNPAIPIWSRIILPLNLNNGLLKMVNADGRPLSAAALPTDLKAEMYATLIVTSKEELALYPPKQPR